MDLSKCVQNIEILGHSTEKNPIHVIFGVDSNFIIPFGVAMTSILQHNSGSIIHLFVDKCSDENKVRIEKAAQKYHAECRIYTVDIDKLGDFPTTKLWSKATYYRLIAARCLEKISKKALYLDADTFCRSNLIKLFSVSIEDKYAAVVRDYGNMKRQDTLHYIRKNLNITGNYFNAGVILINLNKWNEDGISEQAIKYLLDTPSKWHYLDQDVLNVSLKNNVYWLPEKYNVLLDVIKHNLTDRWLNDTCILHFTGAKPWSKVYYPNLLRPTQFDKEYRACFEKSAWNDTNFLNPTLSFCYRMEARRFWQEGKILSSLEYRLKYLKEKITRG